MTNSSLVRDERILMKNVKCLELYEPSTMHGKHICNSKVKEIEKPQNNDDNLKYQNFLLICDKILLKIIRHFVLKIIAMVFSC